MRFTRIPIIATLLAGALSLLFLLPAFGQTTFGNLDRTEGRQRAGDLQVGVFESVGDAQVAKKRRVTYAGSNPPDSTRIFYVDESVTGTATGVGPDLSGTPANIGDVVASGVTEGTLRTADPAFLAQSRVTNDTEDVAGNYVDTRNTTFNGTLYVGSKMKEDEGSAVFVGGYNAVLITLLEDEPITGACDAVAPGDEPPASNPYPVAQVTNTSRGYTINVPLALTATTEAAVTGDAEDSGVYLQAFFNVVDDTDPNLEDNERRVHGPNCWEYADAGSDEFGQIAARHGDRITVRIANQASNIALTVDAEGPEINLISPVDRSSVRPSSLSFRFDVQDSNSGLRHDGEYTLSDDGDATSVNSVTDNDAVRGGEPRSVMTASLFGGGNGKAADIQAIFWKVGDGIGVDEADAAVGTRLTDADRSDDITDQGAWSIIGGRPGVGYSFSASGSNFEDAWNALQFTATDRVGNTTTSDADLETSDVDEPYIFQVDNTEPEIGLVRTGISYDNSKDEEIVDRASIALEFTEPIKSGDVVASRITVIGNSVVGVIQPDSAPIVFRGDATEEKDKPKGCTLADEVVDPNDADEMIPNPNKCPGANISGEKIVDTRNLVFLQLGSALAADAEPDVSLLSGAVQDLAGNDIDTDTQKAEDWIAPTLTVTVTGTKGDRPIANDDGSFMVRVTSDENLRGRPRVLFAEVTGIDNDEGADPRYSYAIGANVSALALCNLTPEETDNAWSRSCAPDVNILTGDGTPLTGLIAVYVLARDEDNSNLAVAPAKWENLDAHRVRTDFSDIVSSTLPEGQAIDAKELHDAGMLIEIDNVFNEDPEEPGTQKSPAESVTPQSGDDEKKTESANPFIHIEFEGEASEYGLGDYRDSHGTVTITEIKLNDEDATDQLSRVAKDEFSVVLRDLAIGKHTLTYKAEDDAGNEYNNGEFKFEVLQRKPYKVNVKPGWNLISLPGAPESAAIADVLSGTEFLTPVLAYQNGDWLTARRTEDGDGWDGSLTEIAAGYGYWVHAQTFETISTLLTEIDPASVPPTVPVARGWNLLGVIDVDQRPAGQAPGASANAGGGEADNYFNSIPWKVAYSYDTQASVWKRYTPDDGDSDSVDEILNGNGYWVWSERPSTLVP